ncbi:carboxypeptidase M32 [Rubritalea spongiae]|uniref:Metal-dependent carboxypeptidase n=1 Tax=Rubritalea spongiae TaxID=430797 RepID=A0ABW5E528_9BACT
MSAAYHSLAEKHREIALIQSTSSILDWDQETNLPRKALNYRAEQLSYLSGKIHQLSTSADYQKSLETAENAGAADTLQKANLREWRHQFDRSQKLSQNLVERDSKTCTLAKSAWIEARKQADFSLFAPHLSKLLELSKEKAQRWGYQDEAYDALLDNYERGAKTKDIVRIFSQYEPELEQLASAAVAKSQHSAARSLKGSFPIASQIKLNQQIAESIGFDFDAGRIDTTTHPFCTTLGPQDIRLTTRYDETDFTSSLFGVMHEMGHGLYEQGLRSSDFGLPSGTAVSLGIHESQSLLWEAHVGRSPSFWKHWLPCAQELFPQLQDWSLEEFLNTINQARYSYIRVDADEATYDLHIMLRFDIERRLLNNELKVDDVPAAWNERFEKLFGMQPESDAQGCLQDIHWAMGGLGYFPTYTLGNLNASQLFHAATQKPEIQKAFNEANFSPLLDWMKTHIHSLGSVYLPQDLMLQATGEATTSAYHLAHLKQRYL